jgi:hypothetical protein
MLQLAAIAALAAASAFPAAAPAEDADRAAIQRKKYVMAHELRLSLGSMPVDPFEKGWSLSLAYTVHFDYVAWEIFQLTGALLSSTDLKNELIDTFAIPPEDFRAARFGLTTGLEIAPFYGKQALFNGAILHQNFLFGVYGGVLFRDPTQLANSFGTELRPAAGAGIGWRFYVGKAFSIRIDVRDFAEFRSALRANEKFDVFNVLLVTFSASFNLGRDDA